MARTSFTLVLLSIAGAMALLLGVIGIYGVIAYTVSQRTREIGIRMALGAQRSELTAMFVRQGMVLTAIGAACGLAVAFVIDAPDVVDSVQCEPGRSADVRRDYRCVLAAACLACYLPRGGRPP